MKGLDALRRAVVLEDSYVTVIQFGRAGIVLDGVMLCSASSAKAGERVWRHGSIQIIGARSVQSEIAPYPQPDQFSEFDFGEPIFVEGAGELVVELSQGKLRLLGDALSIAFTLGAVAEG